MTPDGVALFDLLLAAVAAAAVAGHYLRQRCPRCGSRRTHLLTELPNRWRCDACRRHFGPGSLTDL